MLTWRKYNEKVDIWSAGCIFAEMLLGEPIFPGKNHINQFCVITDILGNPPEEVVSNITSENVSFINYLVMEEYTGSAETVMLIFISSQDVELHPISPSTKSPAHNTDYSQSDARGYV